MLAEHSKYIKNYKRILSLRVNGYNL